MPLISIWQSNPTAIGQSTIEQVVAMAGDGTLRDGSHCSAELREYLGQVQSTTTLADYIEHCLTSSFSKSGFVLQDLVNELGRRLDYKVENGRYQGTSNAIGFDGIWTAPESHSIVVEVKTTDAYRISLDTVAAYRQKLIDAGKITGSCSILIIVGREDTGELEAQIRGSRHAWDIRLISADALVKLVQLKEDSDGPETGNKIRSLLVPMEYTRLDGMIDVMFATAKDVEAAVAQDTSDQPEEDEQSGPLEKGKSGWEFTDIGLLDSKRAKIIDAMSTKMATKLIRRSRALFWDTTHDVRVVCSISKRYMKRSSEPYWYAYHPQWDEFLREGIESFFVLGCMDLDFAFAIPRKTIHENLGGLHTTTTERSTYWHVHIGESEDNQYVLLLPKLSSHLALTDFRVQLK
jgi:hypothetical protein